MIKIYNEDCLKGLKKLPAKSIDTVITSIPYNIGAAYPEYKDNLYLDDFLDWVFNLSYEVYRVLKDEGNFFLNVGSKPSSPTVPYSVMSSLMDEETFNINRLEYRIFRLQNSIIWCKSWTIDENSEGHYKPINSKRLLNDCYEFIWHFTKTGKVELDRLAIGVPYKDSSNKNRYNSNGLRCRGNVWHYKYKTTNVKKDFPCSFPIEIPLAAIKLAGYTKDTIVLDPCAGAGTTVLACKELGCNFIGYEIDKTTYKKFLKDLNEQ